MKEGKGESSPKGETPPAPRAAEGRSTGAPREDAQRDELGAGSHGGGDFYVCGIGASAGGLPALERFFRHTSTDTGIAFVVVQHLSPDHESMMVELLGKYTDLPVERAVDGAEIRPDHVYLIPPGVNITIAAGRLSLVSQNRSHLNLPVDIFFRSLARERGDRAIGVLLSGTGSDGTIGAGEIKQAGGVVVVQEPKSASYDGMPRSVLSKGLADIVLPPEQIAEALARYVRHPLASLSPRTAAEEVLPSGLDGIRAELQGHSGIDFGLYRASTLLRRSRKRMQMRQIDTHQEYVELLRSDPSEIEALHKDVLIGVTSFFRDREVFQVLPTAVFPQLLDDRGADEPIRIWSVGCSTGEEAYTLAILCVAFLDENGRRNPVKVFASDVDRTALEKAGGGLYARNITTEVPEVYLQKYFKPEGSAFQVRDEIRKRVIFAHHDVTRDPPFFRIDLICCRNVLIYLEAEAQQTVLSVFDFALRSDGFLVLGSSETLGGRDTVFTSVDRPRKIFRRIDDAPRPVLANLGFSSGTFRNDAADVPARVRGAPERLEKRILTVALRHYMPAAAVFDERQNVLLTFGAINDYFEVPVGETTSQLTRLAKEPLALALGTLAHRVEKENGPVLYRGVELVETSRRRLVDIVVEPFPLESTRRTFVAIFREPAEQVPRPAAREEEPDDATRDRIRDLEHQLRATRESLQASIEELETSNEEMQASNEEMLASNEELQATNEELQSVNEELVTVNAEYQQKVEELTQLNSDLDALLSNSGVGILFLDSDLRIRRFSPQIAEELDLLASDIGRPIRQLSFTNLNVDLPAEVARIGERGQLHEVRATSRTGAHYLMRIFRYRSRHEPEDESVALTLIDVSEQHRLRERLQRYERGLETSDRREIVRPVRLLLVEDDPDQVEVTRLALDRSSVSMDLHVASDAEAALDLLREGLAPDLLLLDIRLPGMSGIQFLETLRAEDEWREIPIVVVTASRNKVTRDRAKQLGVREILTKPIDFPKLRRIVESVGGTFLAVLASGDRTES